MAITGHMDVSNVNMPPSDDVTDDGAYTLVTSDDHVTSDPGTVSRLSADEGFSLSPIQTHFLIVFALALANVFMGIIYSYVQRLEARGALDPNAHKTMAELGDDNPERQHRKKEGGGRGSSQNKSAKGTNMAISLSGEARSAARGVSKAYL